MPLYPSTALAALTTDEWAALNSPTSVRRFMSIVPNSSDVIGTAITGTPTAGGYAGTIALPYTSGTGVLSGTPPFTVKDMTIWVGTTALANDIGIFRLRRELTTSPLQLMLVSAGDAGLIPQITTPNTIWDPFVPGAALAAGQYITVRASRNQWQAFPRIDTTTTPASFFKDYNVGWGNDTLAPPAIANVKIVDVNGCYAGGHVSRFVDPGQNYATFTLSLTSICWPGSSPTSCSYQWFLPSGATLVSGSLTGTSTNLTPGQGAITVRFPVGWQSVLLEIVNSPTVSAPSQTYALRYIWVHDGTPYAPGPTFPPLPVTGINDVRDTTGRSIDATLLTQDAAQLVDGTMVNIWSVPTFGNGGQVPSMMTGCAGWITTSKPSLEQGLMQTVVTVKNPGHYMQGVMSKSQRIDIKTTPTNWQQVVPALGTAEYFVWYMLRYHEPNFLLLFDFWPYNDPLSNSYLGVGISANAGSEIGQLQEIGKRVSLNVGTDSYGSMWMQRHPSMIMESTSEVSAIVGRLSVEPSHLLHLDWQRNWQNPCGSVIGGGFQYTGAIDPATGQNVPTPFLSRIPADLTGQGVSQQRLDGQLIDVLQTLNNWTGLFYAMQNNPMPLMNAEFPFNLDVIEPSQLNTVWVDLPPSLDPVALGFQSAPSLQLWVPKTVSLQDADGTTSVRLEAEWRTQGNPGTPIPVPNPIVTIVPPPPGVTFNGCHFYDFTAGQLGWSVYADSSDPALFNAGKVFCGTNPSGTPFLGTYVSGIGFQSSDLYVIYSVAIEMSFPATQISGVKVLVDNHVTTDTGGDFFGVEFSMSLAGVQVASHGMADIDGLANPAHYVANSVHVGTYTWPITADKLAIAASWCEAVPGRPHDQLVTLKNIEICTTGTDGITTGTPCTCDI